MQEHLSPQQSLQLIQSMIDKTKANISDNRFYFLLWGWIGFVAIMGQFILKVVFRYEHHYIVWLLTFVGIFFSVFHTRQRDKERAARTYIGDSMRYLWTGMGISFFVVSIIFTQIGFVHSYPFFILLYGLGTFVSGKILQFRPFVTGGIINWALAASAVFFSFDYQMLFGAAALLTSYIIPSYLLKRKEA